MYNDHHDLPHRSLKSNLGRNDSGYAGSEYMWKENLESNSIEKPGKNEGSILCYIMNLYNVLSNTIQYDTD